MNSLMCVLRVNSSQGVLALAAGNVVDGRVQHLVETHNQIAQLIVRVLGVLLVRRRPDL